MKKILFSFAAFGSMFALFVGQASAQLNLQVGQISGRVFIDNNNNGVEDAGDAPVNNARVLISDSSGTPITVYSYSDGSFYSTVVAGNVSVTLDPADPQIAGRAVTTVANGGTSQQSVVVTSGQVVNLQPIGVAGSGATTTPVTTTTPTDTTTAGGTLQNTGTNASTGFFIGLLLLSTVGLLQYYKFRKA